MKYVITIARSYGSGGKEIGKLLSKRLGISYYGREILEMLGNHDDDFINDESVQDSFEAADALFKEQSEIIKKLAEKESCVIVGRCADYILKGITNLVRVYLYAPQRDCMRRVCRLYELNPDDAKNLIHSMNKTRGEYYHRHTGHDRDNALNYDLSLNTAGLTPDECADIIEDYIKKKIS